MQSIIALLSKSVSFALEHEFRVETDLFLDVPNVKISTSVRLTSLYDLSHNAHHRLLTGG